MRTKQRMGTGRLRTIMRQGCAREVWTLVSLLEYKYQAYLYDAVVDYVKNGRREQFGSRVMQTIFDRVASLVDDGKRRDDDLAEQ